MKLRYALVPGFAAAGVLVAATTAFIFVAIETDAAVLIVGTTALSLALITPLIIALTLAGWIAPSRSEQSAPLRRRLLIIGGGLEAVSVIAIVVVVIVAPTTAIVLIPVAVVGVGSSVAAVPIGHRLNDRLIADTPPPSDGFIDSSEIVRKVRRVVLTFAIATVAGFALLSLLLGVMSPDEPVDVVPFLLLAVSMGAISASLACVIVAWSYAQRMRAVLGTDVVGAKVIRRVVVRAKSDALTDEQQHRAAGWAALLAAYLPFSIAQFLLLYVGIGLQQVNLLTSGSSSDFAVWLLVFLVVVALAVLPWMLVQLRRIRRYTRNHPVEAPVPAE